MPALNQTLTLGATPFEQSYGRALPEFLYVAPQSQGAVTLTLYGKNSIETITILAGQPFYRQVTVSKFTLAGTGVTVTITAADQPFKAGQQQMVSASGTSNSGSNYQTIVLNGAGANQDGTLVVPPGQKWRIQSAQIRLTTGATTGNRSAFAILDPGGNIIAGQLVAGPLIADTGTQTLINDFFGGTAGPTPSGETWDTLSDTVIAPTIHTSWNAVLEAVAGDAIYLIMAGQAGDTAELNLSITIEPL